MPSIRARSFITRHGAAALLAAALGAGFFAISTPAAADDRRMVRLPDGRIEYVRDRDWSEWRRWQNRRDRDDYDDAGRRWRPNVGRYVSPYEQRNSGELGDGRRKWRNLDGDDWQRSGRSNRGVPNGRYYQYPADGG